MRFGVDTRPDAYDQTDRDAGDYGYKWVRPDENGRQAFGVKTPRPYTHVLPLREGAPD